jgi:hypothetical protein
MWDVSFPKTPLPPLFYIGILVTAFKYSTNFPTWHVLTDLENSCSVILELVVLPEPSCKSPNAQQLRRSMLHASQLLSYSM